MPDIFTTGEIVYLPKDKPEYGVKAGSAGRIIHIYPNRPHMADVEFIGDGGKRAIAILTKDPVLSIVGFYPL